MHVCVFVWVVCLCVCVGLHDDPLSKTLLAGRQTGLPVQQQQEPDV